MKKRITLAAVAFLLIGTVCAQRNLFSLSFGLTSGIPFYGTEESQEIAKELDSSKRFVMGTYGFLNLNIVEHASVFGGAELLSDFNWDGSYYANHLHMDFPLGLRLSPALAGFSFGTAYLLGFRADFYKLSAAGKTQKTHGTTSWGNGVKLFCEYDFAYHGSKFLPTVGLSWNLMPRGNYEYDNLLQIYMGLNL